jgi:hypothetical protein
MIAGFDAFSTIAVGERPASLDKGAARDSAMAHDSRQGNFFHSILLARLIGGIQIGF